VVVVVSHLFASAAVELGADERPVACAMLLHETQHQLILWVYEWYE
jgi:hypothetical protein